VPAGVSIRITYRRVERGRLHFVETDAGRRLHGSRGAGRDRNAHQRGDQRLAGPRLAGSRNFSRWSVHVGGAGSRSGGCGRGDATRLTNLLANYNRFEQALASMANDHILERLTGDIHAYMMNDFFTRSDGLLK
jgi:hypothetical protein